ncbi:MAG: helix-turn-helix transcriptional regulator [Sphaerochaetaceae bacterium]
MFAFATGSMTLALSVVYHLREEYEWTKYFILFHASLLLSIVLQVLKVFVNLFIANALVSLIVSIVIQLILAANVGFLIIFIPYFTAWITAEPFRSPKIQLFSVIGSLYLILNVVDSIYGDRWLLQFIMMALFIGTLFYSVGSVTANLKNVKNSDVRTVSKAIIILSFVMVPLLAISLVFPPLRIISYPIYFMAFSVIILVFLFIYFSRVVPAVQKELTFDKAQAFNLTKREYGVVELIKDGLTNKEIAEELSISVNTVNNHIANIFSKVNVGSRIDLLNALTKDKSDG